MPDSIFTIGEQYCLVAFQDETDEPNEHTKRLFQKPITIWERMIAELPYSDLIPYAYYYSAVCYRKLGEFEKAVEYFQKAESDLPDDDEYAAKAQFRIGNCYEGLRNKGILPESEANSLIEKSYKAVIEKYPDSSFFPDSAMIVGRHNLRMGQWAEAAKYFEMLLEKAPESPLLSDVLYDLGLAYEQINEPDMAMEIYRTFIETAGPDDPRKEKVLAKLESLKGQSK